MLTKRRRRSRFVPPPDPAATYKTKVDDYAKRLEKLGMPPDKAREAAIDFAKATLNIK